MSYIISIFYLSLSSLNNRRLTVILTICAIAISVMLALGVERVRQDAKGSFANTISGTDIIVGARSGSIQLLLYSVFRIGNATNNISWNSYRKITKGKNVKWTIPISLGDSHRGFRVMGTNLNYFRHFQYGKKRKLTFKHGAQFTDIFDAVLGAEVAEKLDYKIGQKIVIAHGIGDAGFAKHDDRPFQVTGILKKTGTPVDRTVHISLEGITAIHVDWKNGARVPGMIVNEDSVRNMDLTPRSITAFMIGLNSRLGAFRLLRDINNYKGEPLLAILPGVALQELWSLMRTAETAVGAISILVVLGGILCMLTMLLAGLNQRHREMAILRAIGASPLYVSIIFTVESLLIAFASCILGLLLLYGGMVVLQPIIENHFGLFIPITLPSSNEWVILIIILTVASIAGLLPTILAYRQTLADGMNLKI